MLSKLARPYGKKLLSIISTRAGRLRTCKRRAGVRGPRLEKGSESISWCGRRAQAGAPAYPRLCNRRDRRERAGAIRQQQQSQPHETPLQRRRASGRKLSTMMWPGKPSARAVGAGGGRASAAKRTWNGGHPRGGKAPCVSNQCARGPRDRLRRARGVPRPGERWLWWRGWGLTNRYRYAHNVGTWQEGEVSPSAAPPHFRTSCRVLLHRAAEPFCAALL